MEPPRSKTQPKKAKTTIETRKDIITRRQVELGAAKSEKITSYRCSPLSTRVIRSLQVGSEAAGIASRAKLAHAFQANALAFKMRTSPRQTTKNCQFGKSQKDRKTRSHRRLQQREQQALILTQKYPGMTIRCIQILTLEIRRPTSRTCEKSLKNSLMTKLFIPKKETPTTHQCLALCFRVPRLCRYLTVRYRSQRPMRDQPL